MQFFPQSIRARAIELLRIDGPLLSRELAELLEIRSRRGLYDSLAVATMRGELAYAFVEANTKHVFGDGLVKVFGLPEDIALLLSNDQTGAQLPPKKAHWRHAHAMRHPGNRPRLFLRRAV